MITHGKKQISEIVYARKSSDGGGAVRLTNIIRGAQVVFGGMEIGIWLKFETRAAILAAFGQTDGNAVIKATNAYLNALAATDPTKASALAGFINEDPMLVCSLGLQPQGVEMPIRWLVGDGKAYINTGIVMKDLSHIFEVTCRWNGTNKDDFQSIFGFMAGGNKVPRLGLHQYQRNMMFGTNTTIYTNYSVDNVARDYIYNATTCDVSRRNIGSGNFSSIGNAGTNSSSFSTNTLPIFLFARNNIGHNNGYVGDVARFKDNDSIELVPFKSATREGMVDLVNDTFYQNQGTGHFTDTYTLQDGVTPWTPLNQTP